MSVLLAVRGLEKRYRSGAEEVRALAGVDLDIGEGELVVLSGPSGSGKTTLLTVLMGWEEPDAGSVTIAAGAARDSRWGELAVLPQRLGMVAELTVRENVALPLKLSGGTLSDGVVDSLLAELGLAALADRPPDEASLGEQQRAGLARALVLTPRLLLADEPTGHQDEGWGLGIRDALRRRCDAGMAALVATHDDVLANRADRVITMTDGRVAAPA